MTAPIFKVGDLVTTLGGDRIIRCGIKVERAGKRLLLSDNTEWVEKRGEWQRYGHVRYPYGARDLRPYQPGDEDRAAREVLEKDRADLARLATRLREEAAESSRKADKADEMVRDKDAAIAVMDDRIAAAEGGGK